MTVVQDLAPLSVSLLQNKFKRSTFFWGPGCPVLDLFSVKDHMIIPNMNFCTKTCQHSSRCDHVHCGFELFVMF